MAIAEIASGLGGIKSGLGILKTIKYARDPAAFAAKVAGSQSALIDAQNGLIAANQAHTAQIDHIRNLEEEVRRLKTWEAEKKQYELKGIGLGAFAFMLKPEARGTQPPHWLCTNCFERGEKTFIEPAHGRRAVFGCSRCKTMFQANISNPVWL